MKNKFAIYFSAFAMMFLVSSCLWNDDGSEKNPYAYIKSFGIGDIVSSYYDVTSAGKDTMVVRTISGASYPFAINQASGEIYNNDSLPYATDVTKVVVKMEVEGVATMYVDESDAYEYFTSEDSIDFSTPRNFRITSLDGTYSKYYKISVNAHRVQPDSMVWNKSATAAGMLPEKAIESDGRMYLFGKSENDTPVFVSTVLGANVAWSGLENVAGLASDVDFSTLHLFNGAFYVLSAGNLYTSANAVDWQQVSQDCSFIAIIGASDADGYMWLADSENIYRTADGVTLDIISTLPKSFPLYGISDFSYALSHNSRIIRYMLVGYATDELDGEVKVWSRLSNEDGWVEYANEGNPYPCPSLEGLAVMRYDNNLYAFGGKGVVGGNEAAAFASFHISRDNGIVWKAPEGYHLLMPEELKAKDIPFVATVDSDNYMWIITADSNVGVWRGIINRLGFKK